jgi:TonB family protein
MANSRLARNRLHLLTFVLVCFAVSPAAQAQMPDPPTLPLILNRKRATRLLIQQARPEYPPLAKLNYIQGRVRVELNVSREGKVARAHILFGHPLLAAAALRAVRQWIYRPLVASSGTIPFLTTTDIDFSLQTRNLREFPAQPVRDFNRQVKPPVVIARPKLTPQTTAMHFKLLLDDEGHVIDLEPLPESTVDLSRVKRMLGGWAFRPAHWGNLAIPWYIDVDIPMVESALHQVANDPTDP